MANLRFIIKGDDAELAASELTAVLSQGETPAKISRWVESRPAILEHKGVDPIAVTNVVLAVPAALLAATNIMERLRTKKKIDGLKRLAAEKQVSISISAPDGKIWSLDALESDRVIEIADDSLDDAG